MTSTFYNYALGFIALVLVPTAFWFGIAELIAFSFQYSFVGIERLAIGGSIFLLTLWVWALLQITGDE